VLNLTASLLNINEAELTINVLDKLARLSANGWAVQLILVDNGSADDQLRQLTDWFLANKGRFWQILFISASQNLGANGGRNIVFKLASAPRILVLDNDVVLPEDSRWLETLWARMEDNPQIGIVGPMLVFAEYPDLVQGAGIGITDRGRVGYLNRAEPADQVPPTLIEVVASPSACWLVRKEAQKTVGLLSDEFYPVQYEDVDFCVRMGLAGWKILCDRSVRIKHIENVTTRALEDHPFARLTVRQGMRFYPTYRSFIGRYDTQYDQNGYRSPR
jgi:GT2 family glycosyltransferase